MTEKGLITRREFMKLGAGAAVLGGSGGALDALAAEAGRRTTVILVRDKGALDPAGRPVQAVIDGMMDLGIRALTGIDDPDGAWGSILQPWDVLGIKSNEWKFISTTSEVEEAIRKGALRAGLKEADISVDDRGVLSNPVFERSTALINSRPMRTHHWSGVGSLIKNYIMFSPSPPDYHPDSCADLARLWDLPAVKGKTRLNVLVMLTPQFHGVGAHGFAPKYVWRYNGLLLGFDPVAVDATGLRIILAKRRAHFGDDRPLPTPAKHIALADTRHGLGTADEKSIRLVRIGERTDELI